MSQSLFGLSDKVAMVWGGGRGMGQDTAVALAEAGCHVAIVDSDGGRAERVADQIRLMGRRAVPIIADITIAAQVADAVASAEELLGPLDVMVTVVGMAQVWKPVLEMTEEDWQADQELNLKSVFLVTQTAARAFAASGRKGAIVAVSSLAGLTSAPGHAAYGAAKAGLVNFVRSTACELAPHTRVNAVAPGVIRTFRVVETPELSDKVRRRVPLARMGLTREIAKAVLFLASDLASFVTGHTLPVDGGWSAVNIFNAGFDV